MVRYFILIPLECTHWTVPLRPFQMPAPARKPTATSRLMKDYARLQEDPVPYIVAEPNPRNVLEW